MENKMENLKAEDSTKYGEFISSFDRWLTVEEQKRRANHLENNTKTDEKK